MKKIIIVVNNLKVGGVQKSLYNLLWAIHDDYDITLCLFQLTGIYSDQLPQDIRVTECRGLFRYLGIGQRECAGVHKLIRGGLALTARIFGRNVAIRLMLPGEKSLPQEYDCAIAFLQNGNIRNFYGGVQDYVLHRVKAEKKIAFLHCDYGRCGANHPVNNRLIGRFDKIAACSDGCKKSIEDILPELAEKCITVRNCHRIEEIHRLADTDSIEYSREFKNVVMVSRLAHEKGIERAIRAVAVAIDARIPVQLHIVGEGPMRQMLEETAAEHNVAQHVHFYGEQSNPYRYMKNADLFLMTSYHEAAPMVIEEACCLGLPVLTVENTSSHEMVTMRSSGWVCSNDQTALTDALRSVLTESEQLEKTRQELRTRIMDNKEAIKQFMELIEGQNDH